MFVKFCGFTRGEDIEAAAMLPVSSIGYIFYDKSERYITPAKAAEFSEILKGTGILKTGVFVKSSIDEIKKISEKAKLNMVQVYDTETAAALKGFLPVIECFRIKDMNDMPEKSSGDFILLDSFSTMEYGGTGKIFSHDLLKGYSLLSKTIAAGGINSDNIKNLITEIAPFGVDISSGIEISKGIKSSEKMGKIFSLIMEAQNESIA
jgi:phosphoribosylanthranilate isomerase